MSLFEISVLIFFFLMFCFFMWIEYVKHQRQLRYLKEARDKSIMTMEEYSASNQTDVGRVAKEMHQRLKKKQLEQELGGDASSTKFEDDDSV